VPAVAVLYTNKEVAGEVMGDADVMLVKAIHGVKTTLVLELTSN
jgi:hypothetical protein